MKSFRRFGVLVATLAVGAGILSACDKPVPLVSVLANSHYTQLTPSKYCFNPLQCRTSADSTPSIKAAAGSAINIDVPKSVAQKAWFVTAYTLDSTNTPQPITGAGTTLLTNTNNARVTVPFAVGSKYYIAVQQTNGKTAVGTWQAAVEITEFTG